MTIESVEAVIRISGGWAGHSFGKELSFPDDVAAREHCACTTIFAKKASVLAVLTACLKPVVGNDIIYTINGQGGADLTLVLIDAKCADGTGAGAKVPGEKQ